MDRPCAHPKLWDALASLLRMGHIVIFWPGGPPVVANDEIAAVLPNDVVDALGKPKSVQSGKELESLGQLDAACVPEFNSPPLRDRS